MTTTSTFSGMNLEKPSSKVLAPPGGGTSISFGGDPEPAKPRQQPRQQQPKTDVLSQQPQQDCSPARSAKPQGSNFNILSGEPIAASNSGGARGRQPGNRVDPASMPAAGGRLENRQVTRKEPPGGKSSISFGGD